MQIVFGLLVVFLALSLFAREFTRRVRWLMILSIGVMIFVVTFTHYGG
jgi:hypothetical protein